MNAKEMDNQLRIKTEGTLELLSQSPHYNRYEATPYEALDDLFRAYEMQRTDGFVDYGCGKGRVSFYVHNQFRCAVTGIEMNGRLYEDALTNLQHYRGKVHRRKDGLLRFERCYAETYEVEPSDNLFYFFNPFSVQVFIKVVGRILESVADHRRPVDLILYYPSLDYIQYLETKTAFELVQEIKLGGIYEGNEDERFLIYRLQA
ncbi:SAM-dependent methyltransferase [Sporosarcina luteola]|nr:SAM-dependent methyltransferase [Sporosarcina luteola]